MNHKKPLKVVELFAGVGGFRVALEAVRDREETPAYDFVWSNQWEPSTKIQHASDIYVARFGPKDHINKHHTRGRCHANDAEPRRETAEIGQGCSCGNDCGDGCSCNACQHDTHESAHTPRSVQPRQPTSIAPEKEHPGGEEEQPTRRETEDPDTSWRIRFLWGGLHWWHIAEPSIHQPLVRISKHAEMTRRLILLRPLYAEIGLGQLPETRQGVC